MSEISGPLSQRLDLKGVSQNSVVCHPEASSE